MVVVHCSEAREVWGSVQYLSPPAQQQDEALLNATRVGPSGSVGAVKVSHTSATSLTGIWNVWAAALAEKMRLKFSRACLYRNVTNRTHLQFLSFLFFFFQIFLHKNKANKYA